VHQEEQATDHKWNGLKQQLHYCCSEEEDEHLGVQLSEPMDRELWEIVSASIVGEENLTYHNTAHKILDEETCSMISREDQERVVYLNMFW